MSSFSEAPPGPLHPNIEVVFGALGEEVYRDPVGIGLLLAKHGREVDLNHTTLFDLNRMVIDGMMESDAFAADLAAHCTYDGFIGLAITIVMTGVSIVRTWQKTKDNRAKDIAANLMKVKQQLQLTKEAIAKEENEQRRKILVATIIQYSNELVDLKKEILTKNLWAASIVVFAGLSAVLAWKMVRQA